MSNDEYDNADDDETHEWTDEFQEYVDSIFLEATPAPGPLPEGMSADAAKYVSKHRLLSTRQLLAMKEPDWFIEKLIPKSGRMVIHGEPGSKKTFLALDLAVCAQHGLDWHGRKIAEGKVLYILGEGTTFLGKRLRALAAARDMDPEDIEITWMAEPLNLHTVTPEQIPFWAAFVKQMGFKYVVVDTLHMNTAGMEENSAADMGAALARADKIAGDADLIFIHHNTKTGGMRGSSALEGDCDTILEVKETAPLTSSLKSVKIRDAEGFDNLELNFTENLDTGSIALTSVGTAAPKISAVDRILAFLRAEPGKHTKNQVCCAVTPSDTVGTTAATKAFTKMAKDGWIVSEIAPSNARGQKPMIDVWSVDEDAVPATQGLPGWD